MKVALCAIAKNEDKYVDFWAEHYLSRGIDHITIYDNNDDRDLICKHDNVKIVNIHKQKTAQLAVYKEFYLQNKDQYDWLFYCDLDEFIDCKDIKKFLNDIPEKINQVQLKIMNMSDSDNLYADYSVSPFERFTKPANFQWHIVKSFIRTNAKDVIFKSPHYFIEDFSNTIFANGKPARADLKSRYRRGEDYKSSDYDKDEVIMHHCDMKTIEEYLAYKFSRSDAMHADVNVLSKNIPDRCFFRHNEKTRAKLELLSQAPYNGLTDIVLDNIEDYDESMLSKYRIVYIKGNGEDVSKRVKYLNGQDPIDVNDVAEFYIENNVNKRKSIEQIHKYFD